MLKGNVHYVAAEQRRCLEEVSDSRTLRALLPDGGGEEGEDAHSPARADLTPLQACSTPIHRE